ncbi:MAG: TonB-dependent receptor [Erythrobacter sp.]|uniref:TonB-dependent receptor n=1 Tax=Erythrobacter sp. TaxID=1042 RepID=UPI0032651C02
MQTTIRALTTTSLAAAILLPAVPALAQDEEASAESDNNQIIVTARKVEESIQDVPGAITAFSSQDLEDRSVTELEDIALLTPGLVFEDFSNGGFGSPTIRGATQFNVAALEQNVAVFIDGINIPRNYAFDVGATDFSRIEVVKGPQSALYGANAFSGAINYVTSERNLSELQISGKAEVSENGGFDLFGRISAPLVEDILALRLAIGHSEFDGDFTNSHPFASSAPNPGTDEDLGGYDKFSLTVGASFKPVDALQIDFDYYRFETDSESRAQFRLARGTDTNCSPATVFFAPVNQLFCGEIPSTPAPGASGTEGLVVDPRSFGLEQTSELYRIGVDLQISDQLSLSYLYGNYSGDVFSAGSSDRDAIVGTSLFGSTGNVFTFLPSGGFDYDTHELRLEYQADNGIYLLLGGYYQDGTDDSEIAFGFVPLGGLDPITSLIGVGLGGADITGNVSTTVTEKTSVFARAEVPLLDDRLTLNGEIRYTDEDITLTDTALPTPFTRPDSYFTARASIDYKITDDNLIYASAARGFKSGGINTSTFAGLAADERFFGPETNWTYEIGLKNTFLDGAATLNVAAFYIDWSALQLPVSPVGAAANATSITENLGAASSKGIEIEGVWEFIEGFAINAGVAYIDASYDEGTISNRLLSAGSFTALPFENPVLCDDMVCNANGDVGGNDLQRTSDWQWNIGLSGEVPVNDNFDVFGRVDVAGQSEQFVSEINAATIEARALVNARLGIRGDRWSVSVWAKNLFDKEYVSNAFFIANSFQLDYVPTLGNQRRIGAAVSFNF